MTSKFPRPGLLLMAFECMNTLLLVQKTIDKLYQSRHLSAELTCQEISMHGVLSNTGGDATQSATADVNMCLP